VPVFYDLARPSFKIQAIQYVLWENLLIDSDYISYQQSTVVSFL